MMKIFANIIVGPVLIAFNIEGSYWHVVSLVVLLTGAHPSAPLDTHVCAECAQSARPLGD